MRTEKKHDAENKRNPPKKTKQNNKGLSEEVAGHSERYETGVSANNKDNIFQLLTLSLRAQIKLLLNSKRVSGRGSTGRGFSAHAHLADSETYARPIQERDKH